MNTEPRPLTRHQPIGADRDVDDLVHRLHSHGSTVVAGPLGCGKSHLLREVVVQLRMAGWEPVHVRSAPVLSGVPYGALDSDARTLLGRLRAGERIEPTPLLVVDDAQDLDPDAADAVLGAVYSGRATALIALTVATSAHPQPRSTTEKIVNLWLSGFADRIDLTELQAADADALLALFPRVEELDAVARAAVVWRADGSRLLLRELAEAAIGAVARGRDPLAALHDLTLNTRLADALAAHIRELDDETRTTLILIDRAPGITAADAARFTSSHTIETLLARHLVHADRSGDRRLTANASVARAVHREGGSAAEALLVQAMQRLLADGGGWWSEPLAIAVAERWLRGDDAIDGARDTPESLRERVLATAAAAMNTRGDPGRAIAYATLGSFEEAPPALQLEIAYADVLLGRSRETDAPIPTEMLDARTLARCAGICRDLHSRGLTAHAERFASGTEAAGGPSVDDVLLDATAAFMDMRSDVALERVEALLRDNPDLHATHRIRAETLAASCAAHLGMWDRAHAYFTHADRNQRARLGQSVPTADRLTAACVELATNLVIGQPCGGAYERLRTEQAHAAREGGGTLLALAGFAGALAFAHAGEPLAARRELDAAVSRSPLPPSGPAIALTQLATANVLALHGFAVDARAMLAAIDAPLAASRLVDHAFAAAESAVCAAEGDLVHARAAAELAVELSRDTPALVDRARDLYRATVLAGDPDGRLRAALRDLAQETSLPLVSAFEQAAQALPSADNPCAEDVLSLLRGTLVPSPLLRGAHAPQITRISTHHPATSTPTALTRREREIAVLVHHGFSNRAIAGQLFLSVRTVESHIYQARAKVNAATRHELGELVARWAARHPASDRSVVPVRRRG